MSKCYLALALFWVALPVAGGSWQSGAKSWDSNASYGCRLRDVPQDITVAPFRLLPAQTCDPKNHRSIAPGEVGEYWAEWFALPRGLAAGTSIKLTFYAISYGGPVDLEIHLKARCKAPGSTNTSMGPHTISSASFTGGPTRFHTITANVTPIGDCTQSHTVLTYTVWLENITGTSDPLDYRQVFWFWMDAEWADAR